MLVLEDSTIIRANPREVFAFFDEMSDDRYRAWHPEHEEFRWLGSPGAREGRAFYFRETIGGSTLEKNVAFTRVEDGRYLEFAPTNRFYRIIMPKLTFVMEPVPEGTKFTAQIFIRTGPIGARLFKRGREYREVMRHMREESENLKRLLEDGVIRARADASRA